MTNPQATTDGTTASSADRPLSGLSGAAPPPAGCPAEVGAFPLHGTRFQHDPATVYQQMRAKHGSVAPILLDGDQPAWLVLGYREVHYVTTNSDLFARDSRRWNRWSQIPADWPLLTAIGYKPSLYYAEGEEHRRRAGILHDVLAAVDQLELQTHCERIADQLIDNFAGRGEADLVAQYADAIPLLVDAVMFGLSDEETSHLAHDLMESVSGSSGANAAFGRVRDLMERLLVRGRERPGPNVPSRFVAHQPKLTDSEIVEDLIMVIGGGQLTTSCWIGNTLRLMLVDDRFSLTLSGGRRSVGQALNEVLWEDTPVQNFAGRWAVRATELGGQHIEAGDMLILGLAAANADPLVRRGRPGSPSGNHAHLSFSHGEHRCPGPAKEIAELVAKTAVEVLLDRLPDVTLAMDPEALVWTPSPWMRGLVALPVEFTPA